ncbi:MAG: OHCU decarboxylase [Nocardioides sp.]|nr:OHCU decarboxylase [Nocardioides sp.]
MTSSGPTALDDLTAYDARALLLSCADVPRWADELVAARPLGSVDTVLAEADRRARGWTDEEVATALADHPRIGERHAGAGASADHSAREQAGVDPADAEVARRLAEGNAAYEQRFDRVFLVRAAGRDAAEILGLLEQRLTHDDATERAVVRDQLREIALLRLQGALT